MSRAFDGSPFARVVMLPDQVGQDLGVGLGQEGVPLADQLVPEGLVILDDAVMHQRQLAGLVEVGMGVFIGHAAVGGPAGVADADGAPRRVLEDEAGQVRDPPHALARVDRAVMEGRHAGRVITAVLEPPQPVQQDGRRFRLADIADNAAHRRGKVADKFEIRNSKFEMRRELLAPSLSLSNF